MKPYSIDLRQKVVETYLAGGISQRKLAERFRVTPSFVGKLLKQYRDTGTIAPKKRIQQTPPKLKPAELETLKALVEEQNDSTLVELREKLHKTTGVLIGRSTVDRMLKRLNLTLKKNTSSQWKGERTGAT